MDIEKTLREYKIKKAYVETTLARIEQYKFAIAHPEMWVKYYVPSGKEIGMPGAPLRNTQSPIERELTMKELTVDTIKDWIQDDENRIFLPKLKVEQIEMALEALTKQQKAIIEYKYFENMNWKNIEINFNKQYRQMNYITVAGLRKINSDSIDKLIEILGPFYNQFNIA